MHRPFVQNGALKYNGGRSSLSGWLSTPQGAYVLDWELAQFDSAVDDVFGFRAVQVGLPEVDFLRQNRIPYRFTLALEQARRSPPTRCSFRSRRRASILSRCRMCSKGTTTLTMFYAKSSAC